MPWWKKSSTARSPSSSPSPRSSTGSRGLWGHRGPLPRLTRLRKLRHLSDVDVGGLIVDAECSASSTPLSRSPSRNLDSMPTRSSSSPMQLPQPLPLPELPGVELGLGVLPSRSGGGGVPLPSPGEEGNGTSPEPATAQEGVADRVSSASATWRFPNQTARKSHDLVDEKSDRSTFRHYRSLLQDPNSVDTAKFRLNIPAKSAPTSVFSSPARSPQGLSPRRLSNVDFSYNASQGFQVWSAPEISSTDGISFSPRTSPEKIISSPDRSPRYSSSMRSPVTKSRNPSAPPSPLHQKIFPESSVVRHDGNGNINVHPLPLPPLPLPPGPASPPQTGFAHQNPTNPEVSPMTNQWQKGKLIGSGTFGRVYIATNKHTGALCAMKEVNIIPDDPKSAESLKQLEQEIKMLSQLKHPNIVQYYGSELIEDRFYIYLEYVYPGSINKYVRDHCGAMTESVVRNFTRHILQGLAYLHSTNTMHRDIKGANLLVDAHGVVKLADFGMAKHLSGAAAVLSLKGTPHWMAPEVLQATMNKDLGYDLAVDIWSLGCTIIEMFSGKHPWSGLEGPAAMFKVLHNDPHIPVTLSSEGKEFLQLCFRRNPAERPTACMLLDHPFIRNSHHHSVHGSIQAFAGIKLADNRYSPTGRKAKSESTAKGKQLPNGETSNYHPETSESAASRFSLRCAPDVVSSFFHPNQVVPSPSSSNFPKGVLPANGLQSNGAHSASGIHHPYALPRPRG